jgi:hypothetical protein
VHIVIYSIGNETHLSICFPEYTNIVQPVGFAYSESNPIPQAGSLPTFQASHLVQSINGPVHIATAMPTIQLPEKQPQAPPCNPSAGVTLAGSSGYMKNHLSYQLTCQTLANNAYALHGGHVVIVKVWAIHMPVGKTRAQLIGVSRLLMGVDSLSDVNL